MYFMNEKDGIVLSVQKGGGGTAITEAQYEAIIKAIQNRPVPPEGYGYRLKTDLTWELYELPAPDPDPEISDEEALSIILGGDV